MTTVNMSVILILIFVVGAIIILWGGITLISLKRKLNVCKKYNYFSEKKVVLLQKLFMGDTNNNDFCLFEIKKLSIDSLFGMRTFVEFGMRRFFDECTYTVFGFFLRNVNKPEEEKREFLLGIFNELIKEGLNIQRVVSIFVGALNQNRVFPNSEWAKEVESFIITIVSGNDKEYLNVFRDKLIEEKTILIEIEEGQKECFQKNHLYFNTSKYVLITAQFISIFEKIGLSPFMEDEISKKTE
ncbi:MAG: hypothetical protein WDK96_01230 [Candidatus Paceibacterota bacterium]|jgi:hypothetical protein